MQLGRITASILPKDMRHPIRRNPYPLRYRLPGYSIETNHNLEELSGPQAVIAYDLTFNELPEEIDKKIAKLPTLDALQPQQKSYASFLVYQLKQMVASRAITSETAWTILDSQLNKVQEKSSDDYLMGLHKSLIDNVKADLCDFIGRENFAKAQAQYFSSQDGSFDPLKFEFFMRAGETGLEEFDRYQDLHLNIDNTFMRPWEKNEYRKAVWLEMRTIESLYNLKNPFGDVAKFVYEPFGKDGGYDVRHKQITSSINIFQTPWPVDMTLKAEIGHWMFDPYIPGKYWISELMDRMNFLGFRTNINTNHDDPTLHPLDPPAAQIFQHGYLALSNLFSGADKSAFPIYTSLPPEREPIPEWVIPEFESNYNFAHDIAEIIEQHIRLKVCETDPLDRNKLYRNLGIYVLILSLQGESANNICKQIDKVKIDRLETLCSQLAVASIKAQEATLANSRDYRIKAKAARVLLALKNLPKNGQEYNELLIALLIEDRDWQKILTIGKPAIAILEKYLQDINSAIRKQAASTLIDLTKPEKDSKKYKRLTAYAILEFPTPSESFLEKLKPLGEFVMPALLAATKDDDTNLAFCARKIIDKLDQSE